MSEYTDFTKGVVVFLLGAAAIIGLFHYLGKSWVYNDQYKAGLMASCQTQGYTWGECFNVIHGNQESFTK